MTELFDQLAFVSAVLAGFAFTFVGGLLTSTIPSRAYTWVFASSLLAAVTLMVSAVAAVFTRLALAREAASPAALATLHPLVSQSFLLGVVALIAAAAGTGWLRSRRLGLVSMAIALLGLVALAAAVLPFLRRL